MKNMKFLSIIMLVFFMSACDVEDQYPSQTVPFLTINLNGDAVISIPVGTAYVDQGATAVDPFTGATTDLTAENPDAVDVNTPGLYMITYRVVSNNLETVKQRPVAVTNIDTSWDLSGFYLRAGFESNVTEVANGLYLNDNIAGSSLVFPGYMAQLDDSTITVPPQIIPDGTELDADLETLYVDSSGAVEGFSYAVLNPSFGDQERLFVKQ